MPLVTDQEENERLFGRSEAINQQIDVLGPLRPDERIEPTLEESFGAGFRRTNPISSAMQYFGYGLNNDYVFDPEFDPYNPSLLQGFEEYEDVLGQARNVEEFYALRSKVQQEKNDLDVLARSGFMTNMAVAMAADPVALIPFVGVASKVSVLGKGLSALSAAGRNAALFGAVSTAREGVLSETQFTRSPEESLTNIAMDTGIGAVFGGYIGYKTSKEMLKQSAPHIAQELKNIDEIRQQFKIDAAHGGLPEIEDVMRSGDTSAIVKAVDDRVAHVRNELGDDSVGAARVLNKEFYEIYRQSKLISEGVEGLKGYMKVFSGMTPLLRGITSPFVTVREATQKLMNVPFFLEKAQEGLPQVQSVENLKKIYTAEAALAGHEYRQAYKAYAQDMRSRGEKPMKANSRIISSFNEFKDRIKGTPIAHQNFADEVGKAMRRSEPHPNPHIQKAAEGYKKLRDRIAKSALDVGVWDKLPDRKTAEEYFTRMFDKRLIQENDSVFRSLIKDWAAKEAEKTVTRYKAKIDRKIKRFSDQANYEFTDRLRKSFALQDALGDEINASGLTPEHVKSMLDTVNAGKPKRPQTLVSFLVKKGGIRDYGGELKSLSGKRIGLINGKSEMGLDEAAMAAWEEGYFPHHTERPDINDLLSALDEDLRFKNIIKESEIELYEEAKLYDDLVEELDKLGLGKGTQTSALLDPDLRKLRDAFIKKMDAEAARRKKYYDAKIKEVEQEAAETLDEVFDASRNYDDYAKEVADNVTAKIYGLNDVSPEYDFNVAEVGPLKAQKLLIPDTYTAAIGDNKVSLEDFLVNDAEIMMERYARMMGGQIELTRHFGGVDLESAVKPIQREIDERIKLAKSPKEIDSLRKIGKRNVKDIKLVHSLLKGTYEGGLTGDPDNLWKEIGRFAMKWNYMRLLGGVAISSIPDIGKLVGYQGFGKFFEYGLKPAIKNFAGMDIVAKANLEDLKLAGIGIEWITNERLFTLADLGHRYSSKTAFEAFTDNATELFSKATLITAWNNSMKNIGGLISQQRVLRNIVTGTADKTESRFMNWLGLGKEQQAKIADMIKKHGAQKDGRYVANVAKWEDRNAADIFLAAIRKDSDTIIIQKNIGDVPAFTNTAIGQVIAQFKSFIFATNTKTVMPYLQRKDAAVVQGLAFMVGLGMLTDVLKKMEKGEKPTYASPAELVLRGADRSGILHVIMEANNIYEKVNGFGLNRMVGAPPSTRYASRSIPEALLGPTLGTIGSTGQALHAMASGEMSQADRNNIRRLAYFNNVFYIRWLMNLAGEDVRKATGYALKDEK